MSPPAGTLTQVERTLRILRHMGAHGLTQAEVVSNPIDGGAPILRLAVAINKLRNAGYRIDSARRRRGMAVYVLLETPHDERRAA